MGALNAVQHFLWPAFAPTVYNLAIMGGALLLAPSMGVYGLAVGVVVGAWGHLLVQLPPLRRYGAVYTANWSTGDPGVREVLWLMAPRVLGLLFVQMHFLVNTILASGLDAGSLSALNYAWLVMLLPLGIFAQSLATAAFPTFAAQVAAGDRPGMRHTFGRALRTVLFVEIPAAVGLFVFGGAVVSLIFERGAFTDEMSLWVAYALRFYAIGLAGHAGLEIIVRAFYALHDTWTPVFAGMATMILAIGLSVWWVDVLGFGGLALASSIAVLVEMAVLLNLLRPRLGGIDGRSLAVSLARTFVAATCMGVVLWMIERVLPELAGVYPEWLLVILGVGAGALVYAAVAWLLRSPELRWAAAPLLRRLRR
jgi:putative peptidoglycan lipid II flippase